MRLSIRYAKIEDDNTVIPFGEFKYLLNIETKEENEIIQNIGSIMDSYGDYTLDHYLEKDADVFACYIDDEMEPVSVSQKDEKKDPVSIVDGLIRRLNVMEVVLTNGRIIYNLINPMADAKNANNIKVSEYISRVKGQQKIVKGSDVTIFFPYRDGAFSDIPNKKCAENTIPFLFVMNGKLLLENPNSSDEESEDDLKISVYLTLNMSQYDDCVLYTPCGKINVKALNCEYGAYGIFISSINIYDNEPSEIIAEFYCLDILPWIASYSSDTIVFNPKLGLKLMVLSADLNEMIRSGTYIIDNDIAAFAKTMQMCLNDALLEKNHALSKEFFCHTSDAVFFSKEQSIKLFSTIFNDPKTRQATWRVKQDYIKKIVKKACDELEELHPDRDITDDDIFEDFLKRVNEEISVYSLDFDEQKIKWRAAIHEIGHAVVGNKLSSQSGGVWCKVSCEKAPNGEGDAYCEPSDDFYNLLITDEDQIIM